MLRRRRDPDEATDEQTSSEPEESGDAADTLAASVVLLKQSVGDLRALTDEDALDLRARMRTLEDRLSLVEARLAELAARPAVGSPEALPGVEATAAHGGESAPSPTSGPKGEGRKRKWQAVPKGRAARKGRAGRAQEAEAPAGANERGEEASDQ